MNCDNFFQIGSTHEVCQDYSLSKKIDENKSYIILSDGCSSSLNTDIGARILTLCIKNEIENDLLKQNLIPFIRINVSSCLDSSQKTIVELELPQEVLDATSIFSLTNSCSTYCQILGDGIITIKLKDETILVIKNSYKNNYPFYMNYFNSEERLKSWCRVSKENIISFEKINKDKSIENINLYTSKEENLWRILDSVVVMRNNYSFSVFFHNDPSFFDSIFLFSDGIESFYKISSSETSKINEPISFHEPIYNICNIKNKNENFLKRRLNTYLKQCQKDNIFHYDDLSVASIVF